MKVNLKTTNEAENAAETPTCHQRGQRTVNGIIGNTKRGIVIDKTLDPDSNNPVANKPVSTALAALASQLAKGQVVFLDQLPESGEPHKVYVLTATNQRYLWDGNAFVKIVPTDIKDSTTIKHTLAENKISLDLDETIKGKINAALQKPTGLTKTKLVGVGTNGQENIEIGDNLTLANGKLSATGGGSGGDAFDVITLSDDETTYTGTITGTKPVIIKNSDGMNIIPNVLVYIGGGVLCYYTLEGSTKIYQLQNGQVSSEDDITTYSHFITLTNDNDRIYLQYNIGDSISANINRLKSHLSGKKVLCTGVLGNSDETLATPLFVSGESGGLEVYYVLKNDTSGTISNKSITSFTITDLVTPVE